MPQLRQGGGSAGKIRLAARYPAGAGFSRCDEDLILMIEHLRNTG